MAEKKTTPQDPQENLSEEEKKKKAEEEAEQYAQEKLEEWKFQVEDDLRYSFIFKDKRFVFRYPTFFEKTQMKAILAKIAFIPGVGVISSTAEIMGSGDFELMCSATLATHLPVVLEEGPKDFDIEKVPDAERMAIGHAIMLCESEFAKQKKKV